MMSVNCRMLETFSRPKISRLATAFWVVPLLVLPSNVLAIQDSTRAGQEALATGFDWYDSQQEETTLVESPNRRRAASLNRDQVKPFVPKQTQQQFNWPNWLNFGWFSGPGMNLLSWVLIIAIVLLMVGLLVWGYLRMGDDSQSAAAESEDFEAMRKRVKELPFEIQHESETDFRTRARRAYDVGDYTQAIMLLFSHVLLMLDHRGHIHLRKGKTNRQYLREIRTNPSLAGFYQRVMIPFEESFFGGHNVSKSTFEDCWTRLEEFQNQADAHQVASR